MQLAAAMHIDRARPIFAYITPHVGVILALGSSGSHVVRKETACRAC